MEQRTGVPDVARRRFVDIEAADLRSDEQVAGLYLEAVARGWWPNDARHVLDFWALAEKALSEDRYGTPGRLFHGLVRDKRVTTVSEGQEKRAMSRMPSHLRDDLVARAGRLSGRERKRLVPVFTANPDDGVVAPSVGYQHSVLMVCFLPQKRLPEGKLEHTVQHGNAVLEVRAGRRVRRDGTVGYEHGMVPYGSRARLVLPYINGEAVRSKSREIDMGRSLRDFLGRLGMTVDGRMGKAVVEQVEAIAMADILIGEFREDGGVVSRHGRVADQVSFWVEKDERQRSLWEPSVVLSKEYFDVLVERPVPVDIRHLMKLSRSPRRMDLYSWLTYRTMLIGERKAVHVRLEDLQPVFAPDIASPSYYRHAMKRDLEAIHKVYPRFNVDVRGDMLVMRKSPPPIGRVVDGEFSVKRAARKRRSVRE